jgi:nitrite reductase (NADH) small subunit
MAEHFVAPVGELLPGERKIVTIGRIQIGVFRLGNDYFALPNVCTHQFGPLCEGGLGPALVADAASDWLPVFRFEGEVIACPWHNLEFHIPTGQCVAYPDVRLRQYKVRIVDDEIRIVI